MGDCIRYTYPISEAGLVLCGKHVSPPPSRLHVGSVGAQVPWCMCGGRFHFRMLVLAFYLAEAGNLSCFCFRTVYSKLAGPSASGSSFHPPTPTPHLALGVLGLHIQAAASGFLCGFWGMNWTHQGLLASAFTY